MLIKLLNISKLCAIIMLGWHFYNSYRRVSELGHSSSAKGKQSPPNPSLLKTANKILPILSELTKQKFFQYFRVDVKTKCPFWGNDLKCNRKEFCKLNCDCPVEKLPSTWVAEDLKTRENKEFSKIEFADMMKPIKQQKDIWAFDELTENSIYVDLLEDKEQYTGYQGQKIWTALYEDHCMKMSQLCGSADFLYRMISGMHTSVSSHLTEYFIEFRKSNNSAIVFPNEVMYYEKVGKHPERIQNLIFAVEIFIRSFVRYIDLIRDFKIDTGEFNNDMKTKQLVQKLVNTLGREKDYVFDETLIFGQGNNIEEQRKAYLRYFTNITKVMDCVDCLKCKAYGKMQILGMSVALRILLKKTDSFLTRNELVAYINTLAKWVESIKIVDRMKQRYLNRLLSNGVYSTILCLAWIVIVEYIVKKIKRRHIMHQNHDN